MSEKKLRFTKAQLRYLEQVSFHDAEVSEDAGLRRIAAGACKVIQSMQRTMIPIESMAKHFRSRKRG